MKGRFLDGRLSFTIHAANRVGGRVYTGWNDGTFAATTFDDLSFVVLPVTLGLIVAIASAKGLSALLLGETYACSMGTDVRRLRWLTLGAVVFLVAPVAPTPSCRRDGYGGPSIES